MSSFNDPNGQYRRPRLHFSDEKQAPSPALDRRSLLTGSAMLLGLALILCLALLPLHTAEPDAAQTSRDAAQTLTADCTVLQQMTYAPCGHRVTLRVPLPGEMAGKTRAELSAAYEGWQVTAFSPAQLEMERTYALYCPQHIVLLPDESGMLCAWQNKYGDALALVKSLDAAVSELPESAQEQVRQGLGFDSLEALEKWVEGVGS